MNSDLPARPKKLVRAIAGSIFVLAGIVLLVLPLARSTHSPPGQDTAHVMSFWIPGLLLTTLGAVLYRTLLRGRTAVVLAVALVAIWLMHPVCDPIADADVPKFETVTSLEQRAQAGEPFRKLGGHWHQCKRWISRQFFF